MKNVITGMALEKILVQTKSPNSFLSPLLTNYTDLEYCCVKSCYLASTCSSNISNSFISGGLNRVLFGQLFVSQKRVVNETPVSFPV